MRQAQRRDLRLLSVLLLGAVWLGATHISGERLSTTGVTPRSSARRVVSGAPTQLQARAAAQDRVGAADPVVDYNWDIRPILSENCFRCHGPDEKSRMAGLRLDQAESALAELRSGKGKHAVVPGDASGSELIRRVTADNPAQRMPPRSTNKTLLPEQVDLLRRWINQGAKYKPHWAFIPPEKVVPPAAAGRLGNDIDRFVIDRLKREGLMPLAEADKETLINRASLVLTGLPPSLADVDAFLKDSSKNAYEKVVDRLIASPAYGEHMASYWMNIARYSESDGFLDDYHDRLFWPYRDWVISAFNKNMPYDQFSTWQLAGDLLPSHTNEQVLATAFLRLGKRTTENGAIDEEYRIEYTVDRATTVGVGFLGMTVGCARCHDHKYDPIAQKDFYSLTGFFNSNDEPGYYAPGMTGVTAGPTLDWPDPATAKKLADADALIKSRSREYSAAREAARAAAAPKVESLLASPDAVRQTLAQSVNRGLVAYYPFEETAWIPDDKMPTSRPRNRRPSPPMLAPETLTRNIVGTANRPSGNPPPAVPPGFPTTPAAEPAGTAAPPAPGPDGNPSASAATQGGRRRGLRPLPADLVRSALVWSPSRVAGADPAVLEAPILKDGIKGKAFWFDDTNRGFLGTDVGYFERTQPFSLDFWIFAAAEYEDSAVLTHREDDNSGNAGYQLDLEKNRLRFDLMHSRAGNRIRVVTMQAVPVKQWTHVTVTYDGSSQAAGVSLYLGGVKADLNVVSDNLTRTMIPNGGGALGDEFLGLAFGKRFRMTTLKDGALDEIRVFKTTLTPLEVAYLHDEATANRKDLRDQLLDVLVNSDERVQKALSALTDAREAQNQIISRVPEILVMRDTPTPRPTYLLVRGLYSEHGEEVKPQGLTQIFPWNDALPRNRLGLAQWLFDPKNPLTSRVFVNRLWQQAFGRGLVETSEDFGSQGSIPSHPELLDWLATTFRESGWDVKKMQKLIVMSETFRQSSVASDDLLKRDPRNILLARFSRVRMPAELVRDNALAASGLLVNRIGGPSAYPYQPEGIWDGFAFYGYPDPSSIPADEQHRRSLYSFVKRNGPHPAMATFDMPDRGTTTVRRQTSNTPLQALVLLDDPQYLEAYRVLAEHVMKSATDEGSRISQVFRLSTRRKPRSDELAALREYYDGALARYRSDQASAQELVSVGVAPRDTRLDVAELAAMTNVTAAVMNSPAAYTLR